MWIGTAANIDHARRRAQCAEVSTLFLLSLFSPCLGHGFRRNALRDSHAEPPECTERFTCRSPRKHFKSPGCLLCCKHMLLAPGVSASAFSLFEVYVYHPWFQFHHSLRLQTSGLDSIDFECKQVDFLHIQINWKFVLFIIWLDLNWKWIHPSPMVNGLHFI